MFRTSVLILAALLLLTSTPPLAAAHFPSCISEGEDPVCADPPSPDDWITCGTTPSTWPMCGIEGAAGWCSSECFVYLNLAFTIAVHCFDHLRIDHEICGGDIVETRP